MSLIDNNFFRTPSKGSVLKVRLDGTLYPTPMTEDYIYGMTTIVGARTITTSKSTCTVMDMTELIGPPDIASPNPPILSPDGATQNGVSAAILTALPLTAEQYHVKVKAPGSKQFGEFNLTLNMTSPILSKLDQWQTRKLTLPFAVLMRSRVTVENRTLCAYLALGFVSSLKVKNKVGEITQVDLAIQPAFGVGFLSTCTAVATMARVWANPMVRGNC